jgi:hypothetical protein
MMVVPRRLGPHSAKSVCFANLPHYCGVATLRLPGRYNHRPVGVRKPSIGALLLGLIPFVAMCLSVSLWDRIEPMIFGLPFNLFWLVAWIVLSSLCMWAAYRV